MQKYLTPLVIVLALLSPGLLWADTPAKPTDPQIAHIAYTAGLIDVEAGKLALEKSQEQRCARLRPTDGRGSHRGQRPSAGSRKEAERDARGQRDQSELDQTGGSHARKSLPA